MSRPEPTHIQRVAIIGTGVIGGGWATHFLRMGLEVTAWDPAPNAEARLRAFVADKWPAMERLGLRPNASPARLTYAATLAEAVERAEFVQENAPENLETKRRVLAQIDAATPSDMVISSSTSGFGMTEMQVDCQHPERTVVGHPFNPPYLIPLVETVGGVKTDPAVVDWTHAFYTHFGKHSIKMARELPGFLANRLQDAVWREVLHMVKAGEATVEELDASIAYGPGLRWALMGPSLTYHLGGGEGGMRHLLEHFGPALEQPWTRCPAPTLTDELCDRMVAGCEREALGRPVRELEQERDDFLIELLALLEKHRAKYQRP